MSDCTWENFPKLENLLFSASSRTSNGVAVASLTVRTPSAVRTRPRVKFLPGHGRGGVRKKHPTPRPLASKFTGFLIKKEQSSNSVMQTWPPMTCWILYLSTDFIEYTHRVTKHASISMFILRTLTVLTQFSIYVLRCEYYNRRKLDQLEFG